jgi:hypothetical protein
MKMNAKTQKSKIAPKQIGNAIGLASRVATVFGVFQTASAAEEIVKSQAGVADQLADVAASQKEVAAGLGEVADAEVISSGIEAAGEILSSLIQGDAIKEIASGIIEGIFG